MNILRRLFGGMNGNATSSIVLAHFRGFQQEVVGEASYQKAILSFVGGKSSRSAKHECTATLVCDDANKYDENAVEVRTNNRIVGYLPKNDAKKYRENLQLIDSSMPIASVRAKVVGGWRDEESEGHFGVKLNLKWPLKIV